ncbi:MAG: MerR family transcriptional regulator [Chloroflexota bacterium]
MPIYTIQQAAQATGASIATLRYYEQEGLIDEVERLPNGHRRYTEHHIAWIEFLICMRDSGMSIQDLKQYVRLSQRKGTGPERCALLESHREAVKAQIATLEDRLERIEAKITWYHEALGHQSEQQFIEAIMEEK